MDVQVKELIEKIKSDGIKNAESTAARIISEAEGKAATIIENAKREAAETKELAKNEVARLEQAGQEALKQAGRDLLIATRKDIEGIFDRIIEAGTGEILKGDPLKDCIVAVLKSWKESDMKELQVMVPEKTLTDLEKKLKQELKARIDKGLEVKPFKDIEAGFRVSTKDGRSFYDFSDGELTEMLSRYLSPGLREVLDK